MRPPRVSGVYLSDTDTILVRALEASGLGADARVLIDDARSRARMTALPHDAESLWNLCATVLVPLVGERKGANAAERLRAKLHGALLVLDAIQHGRQPGFPRRR